MGKYLFKASYSPEGTRGLLKEGGSSRKALIEKILAGMGGKLETFYYAFGEYDVYAIADVPDPVSAAAIGLAINASGMVSITTTVLLEPGDVDKASKKSISYRAPGAS
jgi:uncharacterized protein with GYD domain